MTQGGNQFGSQLLFAAIRIVRRNRERVRAIGNLDDNVAHTSVYGCACYCAHVFHPHPGKNLLHVLHKIPFSNQRRSAATCFRRRL